MFSHPWGEHPIALAPTLKHPSIMQKALPPASGKESARLETPAPTRNQVAAMAYQIFLDEGCPEGCHLRHWLEAEAQLLAGLPLNTRVL